MNLAKIISFLALLSIFSPQIQAQEASPYGKFVGNVEAKWLAESGESRLMELLKEFSYIDQQGRKWTTPQGWRVDGASIPRILWTIVGSPFTGNYRRASVVHDYYCDVQTMPWQDVHKMFYWASRADGVNELGAKILYAGVYAGGPRWKMVHFSSRYSPFGIEGSSPSVGMIPPPPPPLPPGLEHVDYVRLIPWLPLISDEKLNEISLWIERENPTLEEIEQQASRYISQEEPPDIVQVPPKREDGFLRRLFGN